MHGTGFWMAVGALEQLELIRYLGGVLFHISETIRLALACVQQCCKKDNYGLAHQCLVDSIECLKMQLVHEGSHVPQLIHLPALVQLEKSPSHSEHET